MERCLPKGRNAMNHRSSRKGALRRCAAAILAAAMFTLGAAGADADEAERIMGDIDGDGVVTSADALTILRHSVGIEQIDKSLLEYADLDTDGEVTSSDALLALKGNVTPYIEFPETYTACCGERLNLKAKMEPADVYGDVKFEYLVGISESTDGMTDENGDPYKVLDITNTGRIKAFHPGTATVKAVASNGMRAVCTVTVKDMVTSYTITSGSSSLKVTTHMMTNNDCYNMTDDFTKIDGVVVHSTATPGVMADRWYTAWNKPNTDAAVHSFLDDNGVYNYLPLDQTAWHAGQPANKTYLDFEICEPSGFYYEGNTVTGYDVYAQTPYFNKIWSNATLYTAFLCDRYGLTADEVISHGEAGRMGIGTNHGDPDHWFVLHNKDMDDFRADVAKLLSQGIKVSSSTIVSSGMAPSGASDEFDESEFEGIFAVWDDYDWR